MIDVEAMRRLALGVARGMAPLARRTIGGIGAILMLHRVTRNPPQGIGVNAHLTISPAFLDTLLGSLQADGLRFVTMDEAAERLRQEGSGNAGRFAVLTADDGYRDNFTEALPVLERHGVPITVYVAPGLIDGAVDLWWDMLEAVIAVAGKVDAPGRGETIELSSLPVRRAAFRLWLDHLTNVQSEADGRDVVRRLAANAGLDPGEIRRKSLMTWQELARFAAHPLVTIGAHTISHFALKRLAEDEARSEIARSVGVLAERLGKRPRHFAYPYGYPSAVGAREARLAAEAGLATAVTTRHGLLQPGHSQHRHALPRLSLNGRYQEVGHVRTMLSGITTPLANRGKVLVTT